MYEDIFLNINNTFWLHNIKMFWDKVASFVLFYSK